MNASRSKSYGPTYCGSPFCGRGGGGAGRRLGPCLGGPGDAPPTFATVFEAPAGVRWDFEENRSRATLTTDELELHVERGEFHFEVRRRDGTHVIRSARDASGRSLAYRELNDAFALV